MKERRFATEADLCAAFLAWVADRQPDVTCYAEWAGWDILLVYPDGYQLGIQAKLRLNADVLCQAAMGKWHHDQPGPDFRAVLVPDLNPMSSVAALLGLEVFWPSVRGYPVERFVFHPSLDCRDRVGEPWFDWNPAERLELPPVPTDAIAGSPCPVTLTPWKLHALSVLAELSVKGTITTKRMREIGVNPSRWLTAFWLMPGERRGDWIRGERCPRFDEQHPAAFAAALDRVRSEVPA